jgi:ribose 5-phosphate isomerase B
MRIAVGADHAGFALKEDLCKRLRAAGHEVVDHGTTSDQSVDYPEYAASVARDVVEGRADRGILVCSTGVGMSIAANKVEGVRAALVVNPEAARLTRSHNDANIMTLGAKFTAPDEAAEFAKVFLETPFDGGRHQRRIDKVRALEHGDIQQTRG